MATMLEFKAGAARVISAGKSWQHSGLSIDTPEQYIRTMSKFRSFLYAFAKLLGDINAVRRNRVGRRIGYRLSGKLAARGLGRLWR